MKYRCLVVDHDDTVVNSTATVHYPCFVEYMQERFPEVKYTLEEYFVYNFDPGVVEFFEGIIGMDKAERRREQDYWNAYVKRHTPQAYEGMREVLWQQKDEGGILCVVSHSYTENILRDYRENGLPEPDMVFGWESPAHERKPSTFPLERIMEKFSLRPDELLVLDDLKPGYDMAMAAGVNFAAAGWANDIPQIEGFMRKNCGLYFKTVDELRKHLFG